jgi:iron complex outermembrane recepter protein
MPVARCVLAMLCCCTAAVRAQSPEPPAASEGQASLTDVEVRAFDDRDRTGGSAAVTLSGATLEKRLNSTLGETLAAEPGMSASGYAPAASRPVIRGQDSDRIQLLQNGSTALDASALSFDHASTIEPMLVDRIEVLRGPAALRFGSSAQAGVINATDNRIPTEPIQGTSGRAEMRVGGADSSTASVGLVEAGNGQFAVHADGFERDSADLKIPGFARSARQRALDAQQNPGLAQPDGRLPNTASRAQGMDLGGSATWETGYLGVAAGALRSNYGTPAETDVFIDLRKNTAEVAGEQRQINRFLETLRFRISTTDYEHQEKQRATGAVNTTFRNEGTEARVEAEHGAIAGVKGVIGMQASRSEFSALGDEAFVPRTRSDSHALFALERLDSGPWSLLAGGRVQWARVDSAGNEDGASPRFGAAQGRSFNAGSLSMTLQRALAGGMTASGTISSTQRAPSFFELYSNGPHGATGTWELGDASLAKERSWTVEAGIGNRSQPVPWRANVYYTRYGNFLELAPTGRWRADDGSLAAVDAPGALPEYQYRQVPAVFRGIEAQARWPVSRTLGSLDLETRAEYLQAYRADTGEPLPRIAPLRMAASLQWQRGDWHMDADLTRVQAQNRVASNETPTDGYTMVDLWGRWRFRQSADSAWEWFFRAANLLNVEARNHVSLLKDIAPMGARSISTGVRVVF